MKQYVNQKVKSYLVAFSPDFSMHPGQDLGIEVAIVWRRSCSGVGLPSYLDPVLRSRGIQQDLFWYESIVQGMQMECRVDWRRRRSGGRSRVDVGQLWSLLRSAIAVCIGQVSV